MAIHVRTNLVPVAGVALVVLVALAGGAQAAGLLRGSVTSREIKDRSIKTIDLGLGSVTARTIRARSVTQTRLADGAVTSAKLAGGSVTSSKLAAGSVTGDAIAAGAVTSAMLAPSVRATMDGVWARASVNPASPALTGSFTQFLGGTTYAVTEPRVLFGATIMITSIAPAANALCRLMDGAAEVPSVPRASTHVAADLSSTSIQLAGIADVPDGTFAPRIECFGSNAGVLSLSAHFVGLAGTQAIAS